MELEGKIFAVLPERGGVSERTGNAWKSQDYVVDYFWWPNQTFPSKVVMRIFGADKIERFNLQVNDEVKIRYHFEANQNQGRWFNDVRIDGVTFVGASAGKNQPTTPQETTQATENKQVDNVPQQPQTNAQNERNDDLPF